MIKRDEEILQHYTQAWGQNSTIRSVRPDDPQAPSPIYVAEFPGRAQSEDWVYATIGMSRSELPGLSSDSLIRSLELLLYVRQREPDVAPFLADLAAHPFAQHTALAPGQTLRRQRPIVPGSRLIDVLFARPSFESKDTGIIHHSDGSYTALLWVIPIHVAEHQFVREHGVDALTELFRLHATDTSDLSRPPVMGAKLAGNSG